MVTANQLYDIAYDLVLHYLDIDLDDAHFVAAQLLALHGADLLDHRRDWEAEVRRADRIVTDWASRNNYRAPWNPFDEKDWEELEWIVQQSLQKRQEQ